MLSVAATSLPRDISARCATFPILILRCYNYQMFRPARAHQNFSFKPVRHQKLSRVRDEVASGSISQINRHHSSILYAVLVDMSIQDLSGNEVRYIQCFVGKSHSIETASTWFRSHRHADIFGPRLNIKTQLGGHRLCYPCLSPLHRSHATYAQFRYVSRRSADMSMCSLLSNHMR
ncbi:hypothetical protein C8R48DRAFT_450234 [Suillus tomentosus]|nr:hypothetical protein C8R48DRAFT_450234 [Suillus tomentosus]